MHGFIVFINFTHLIMVIIIGFIMFCYSHIYRVCGHMHGFVVFTPTDKSTPHYKTIDKFTPTHLIQSYMPIPASRETVSKPHELRTVQRRIRFLAWGLSLRPLSLLRV